MSKQFVRGIGTGDGNVIQRLANLESFLSGYRHEKATVENSFGMPLSLDLLAKRNGRPPVRKELPFYPTLFSTDAAPPAYYVTVSDGKVNERDLKAGLAQDAMPDPLECKNRMDGDERRKFPIKVGESIFVAVLELPSGSIGSVSDAVEAVTLTVKESTTKSLNYIPGKQSGVYYYELAKCILKDNETVLQIILGGSHIFHTSGLTGDVRWMSCHTPPAQLGRLSFVSGVMVKMGASIAERALAPAVHEISVEHCS